MEDLVYHVLCYSVRQLLFIVPGQRIQSPSIEPGPNDAVVVCCVLYVVWFVMVIRVKVRVGCCKRADPLWIDQIRRHGFHDPFAKVFGVQQVKAEELIWPKFREGVPSEFR